MRVAILDDYAHLALKLADWSACAGRCELQVFDRHLSEDEAVEQLQDFDVICLLRERMAIPRSLLLRLPRLKLICITGSKHRTLDLATAIERGITVSFTARSQNGQFATAELAWGMMLSLARHIPAEVARMKIGGWQDSVGYALAGRTLGLLGLGRLGSRMVPIARAFDMDVIAWSQNLSTEAAAQLGATRVEKDELFSRSDFLSLHLVLSERSRGIVGARELGLMKPSAYLINTSRGPLIDHDALLEALRQRRIAGAALDTFEVEPLPDDEPLRQLDNALLTPHIGYMAEELLTDFYRDTVENLQAWLDGKPIRTLSPPASKP